MNAKLKLIAERASEDLIGFMQEAEKDIQKALQAAAEEARVQETKATFRLGYSIALDLDKDHMETALSWSVKHKVSRDAPIPDPDQIKLPLDEDEDLARRIDEHMAEKPHIKAGAS